ncbi:uncharacterized protein LOC126556174 [Anopheles maculipalpis]|uniref:uncharacterized protein LOC126556174 n=1 Tax=Anopheles maculipalpis TaxID=1496333 RepID=UPI00215965F1|nr:uncharacterized protein LOC126556174 [Anopheles maculipalpis]
MFSGKFSVFEKLLIALIVVVNVVHSCPETRQCYPDEIATMPCQGTPTFEWTMEPSEIDCSVFISCFNGIGILMCCQEGLYYNPDTQRCEPEANVDCQIEPQPCETTTENPDITTTTTPEESTTTNEPDITTSTEEAPTTNDPDITTSTEEAPTTNDPDSTTTTETDTTEDETTTAAVETTTVEEGVDLAALCAAQPSDELVELAYPGDCTMSVVCENRELIATDMCPAGLHFNPSLFVCDTPDHAECLDFVCQNNPDGNQATLASLNSCQRYYICIGNVTVERFCAPGTIFEAANEWCIVDDVENPCEPDRLPPPPEAVIEQCTEENELNKIAHPTLCDVYYRCLNGRLWIRQCPTGLFFDPERSQCNLPDFVSCEITR